MVRCARAHARKWGGGSEVVSLVKVGPGAFSLSKLSESLLSHLSFSLYVDLQSFFGNNFT